MNDKNKFRSIKTETIVYTPLLIIYQHDINSAVRDPINKKCVVCNEIFNVNMTDEEEKSHIDAHTDADIAKILIYHTSISEIKPIK